MRTLKIIVAVLLVAVGLAGCGLFQGDGPTKEEEFQAYLDQNATFTVFLNEDVTDAQRTSVEAALRALPDVADVTFADHDDAMAEMKRLYSADPEFLEKVSPEALPLSFKVRMADNAAIRKVRDGGAPDKLPGVQKVVYTCLTLDECKRLYAPQPSPSA